ncbi:hypothetical protein PCE1_002132 [Barthelona sp. PCE]
MEVKDITNDKPRKSCLKEELYELYVDAKIPNINRAGLVEVTEKELVRLKGMMVFSFLPTKFKRCASDYPAIHLISDHVYVNMAKDFYDPVLYRGLVGYIISILCTNYYLDFSPSNEDRKKVVMRYTPEVEPQTNVRPPLSTSFLSPSRSYSNRMESELSQSAQSVREPPLSAQRVADEFDFSDTGIRERDVRAALVHGHTHESVEGLPGFRAIIKQHSSASASNSGVEHGFSKVQILHKNGMGMFLRTRFHWFLLGEASVVPYITYDKLKEIVKTI